MAKTVVPRHPLFWYSKGILGEACPKNNKGNLGFDFTNILRAAFTRADSKIVKKDSLDSSHFAILGPACIKAL
jgi:hypothetical protein